MSSEMEIERDDHFWVRIENRVNGYMRSQSVTDNLLYEILVVLKRIDDDISQKEAEKESSDEWRKVAVDWYEENKRLLDALGKIFKNFDTMSRGEIGLIAQEALKERELKK